MQTALNNWSFLVAAGNSGSELSAAATAAGATARKKTAAAKVRIMGVPLFFISCVMEKSPI
jgi:hypothetical protein